jgi:ABC-2 type transport system ATP-binding protein
VTSQPTVAEAVVHAEGLTKRYGDVTAVDGLSLDVRHGEVFGLLGPNGAGKTTTILMLLGLTEPTSGTARVAGLDPVRQPLEVKRHVGYLPDDVGFYGNMTGRQNLRYTGRLNGWRGSDADDRIGELLEQVGLASAADRRVDAYSRGMRQRLGIADALVKDPDVVVLDEPTIAIDPRGVDEILALISSLALERGAAVLLSSHQLQQVEQVCDRVAIFVRGKIVVQGSRDELASRVSGGIAETEVEVPVAADLVKAAALVQEIPGVSEVVVDGSGRLRVRADAEVRSRVAATLMGAGIPLLGLTAHHTGLDELYRRYFDEGDRDDA